MSAIVEEFHEAVRELSLKDLRQIFEGCGDHTLKAWREPDTSKSARRPPEWACKIYLKHLRESRAE